MLVAPPVRSLLPLLLPLLLLLLLLLLLPLLLPLPLPLPLLPLFFFSPLFNSAFSICTTACSSDPTPQ
jgi:hypothetical protein